MHVYINGYINGQSTHCERARARVWGGGGGGLVCVCVVFGLVWCVRVRARWCGVSVRACEMCVCV